MLIPCSPKHMGADIGVSIATPDTMGKQLKRIAEELGYPHVKIEAWRREQAMPARLGMHCPQAESEAEREKPGCYGARGYSALTPPHLGFLTPPSPRGMPSLYRRQEISLVTLWRPAREPCP